MSSYFGKNLKVSVFGQSHGAGIGMVMDGFPAGFKIDMDALNAFMQRRAPGQNRMTTARKEKDLPKFLSGLVEDTTCGAPMAAVIENTDMRKKDYAAHKLLPRPGHADYTAQIRYGGYQDVSGGGHFSGRLTAPLCIAGGICLQMLESRGIKIMARIRAVHGVEDVKWDMVDPKPMQSVAGKPFPVIDDNAGEKMQAEILDAARKGDSVGGVVEVAAFGVPAGLGDPMFMGVENRVSQALFGIPAVKGVEFGAGFAAAGMYGSENNDAFYEEGPCKTNASGGILGGITSGMPVVARVAIKPTPSIALEQDTIDFETGKAEKVQVNGRHDPCIVPRAVPVVEAVFAMAIMDMLLDAPAF